MKHIHAALPISAAFLAFLFLAGCPKGTPVDDTEEVVFTETLYWRYVEHYDSLGMPLESWLYGSDGSLEEYAVYNGDLTEVLVYKSDDVLDNSTLIGKVVYQYDGNFNPLHGELQVKVNGVMTPQISYEATYNGENRYLTYIERDGSDNVVVHRICTYEADNLRYNTETFYSDEAATNKIEEYAATYDTVDPSKYIQETHYLKISASDPTYVYPAYERNILHTFTWNGDTMYLQTDFDEIGTMVLALMYTFDQNGNMKSRSYFNQDGKLILYRTYQYDDSGALIEVRYYNFENSEGNELVARETFSDDGLGTYEEKIYTYNYASRSLEDAGVEPLSRSQLERPELSHHHRD